jgi:RNA polymerase sigma-70 factor (ECF subfamily)
MLAAMPRLPLSPSLSPVQEAPEASLESLFEAAKKGDPRALDALCRQMRPRLFRIGLSMLKNPHAADDLAQDAIVRAITKKHLLFKPRDVGAWMSRIAYNLAKNRLRDQKNQRRLLDDANHTMEKVPQPHALAPAPDAMLEKGEEERAAAALLGRLSPRQEEVARLRIYGQLSFAQIADALNISPENARVAFSQAKKRLLTWIRENGGTP